MSEKSFLMILGPIWSKIVFWKKKVAKFAQKYWKSLIFWISPNHKMARSGRYWPIIIPKHRLCPKVIPKFFLCPKPKNSWKYSKKITPPPKKRPFFWGGVMILNVVFAGFDAAWWCFRNNIQIWLEKRVFDVLLCLKMRLKAEVIYFENLKNKLGYKRLQLCSWKKYFSKIWKDAWQGYFCGILKKPIEVSF